MPKVALIGLDGMTFHLLEPLVMLGCLPFFEKIMREGVVSRLMSTENPVTPAAWVSMYTGKNPQVHGVYDFMHPVAGQDYPALRFTDSRSIRSKTIWELASEQGQKVVSLNFFGMAPPRQVNGFILGGFVPWKHLRMNVEPKDYYDKLKNYLGDRIKLLGMDISEEKKIVSGLPASAFGGWVEHHTERNSVITDASLKLLDDFKPDIFSVVYDGPDKVQHIFWRYLDPDYVKQFSSTEDQAVRAMCTQHYIKLDREISRLVDALGTDCNLIFTSDHGFGPTVEIVYMNQILSRLGLLTWSGSSEDDKLGGLAPEKLKDHMGMIDWVNTMIYAPTPSGNALYLTPGFKSSLESQEGAYQDIIDDIVQKLESVTDESGNAIFAEIVINWERYYNKPCPDTSPDIIIKLRDGGFISVLKSKSEVAARSLPEGTHRPDGIFIGHGPFFQGGISLNNPLQITSITPLMLALAGVDIPSDLSSPLPIEVLSDEFVANHQFRVNKDLDSTVRAESVLEAQPHIDKAILVEQLKALGYID
jgi:predicted AlkP superfamily phosphohydrolase/phosphomutase